LRRLSLTAAWLEKELLPKSNGNFRIGENKFRDKLRYTLDSDLSIEEILKRAQADLQKTQDELYETARSLSKMDTVETEPATKKKVIKAALDQLAESRPTNETIVGLAKADLDEVTEFVRQQGLVTVPQEPVKIIVMPEFQRGVAVAYCDSPGPSGKER
jgi:predicted nuclease with TOPRIM domain